MIYRDLLGITPQDEAFMEGSARHIEAFGDLLDTAHLDSRLTRFLKEAEAIKAKMMELHADEAANCIETSICAVEDAKAAL